MQPSAIRMLLVISLAGAGVPSLLSAQRVTELRVGIAPQAGVNNTPVQLHGIDSLKGTYWWVGALATGVPVGIVSYRALGGTSAGTVPRFLAAVCFAAIAALPGAIIGSWFKK